MKLSLGENIRRLRRERDMTQEQLTEALAVSFQAISRWENGETFPDITLLQPLAYYFGVTLDCLMGYDGERVKAQIDETLEEYQNQYLTGTYAGFEAARDIIIKAYREYPGDYRIMSRYMWFVAGDMADNDPATLIEHRDEFILICDKILEGCSDDDIRLGAWNMKAKILHAEGRTDEALEIYKSRFADWYQTRSQKSEQLFAKDTDEYYFWVRRNMYELFSFAADKLARTVFFDKNLTVSEKTEKALQYSDLLTEAYQKTGNDVFLIIAQSFLGRMENDLCYRGGTGGEVAKVMDARLHTLALLSERVRENAAMREAVFDKNYFWTGADGDLARYYASSRKNAKESRHAELLNDPEYLSVLEKYIQNS